MIVDFHVHLFPPEFQQDRARCFVGEPAFEALYKDPGSRMVGTDEVIRSMDENGVDLSVVFGFPWRDPQKIKLHNDYILDAVARHPTRLKGFCCFDVEYPQAVNEVERCLESGMSGVGELATYLSCLDAPLLDHLTPVMELCRENHLPVMFHTNEPVGHQYPGKAPHAITDAYQLIRRFPDNAIVLPHWGGGLFFYSLLKKEVKELLTNVYFDTAASPYLYDPEIYRKVSDFINLEKVLFGSDFPLIRPQRYFREMQSSGLSEGEIRMIQGENARKLLNL